MNCPQSELHTVTIDDRTRGVRGCGQQATYVEACESVKHVSRWESEKENCTWVLNADSKRPGAPEQRKMSGD